MLNFGGLTKDFHTEWNDDVNFPTNKLFDFKAWRERDTYFSIVREDENIDLQGNDGQYIMGGLFTLCCLFNYKDDATMQS